MAFNKAIIIGRLTAEPELKQTQQGTSVCSFTVAVDRKYKSGEERKCDFLNVVAWRQTAEFVSRYFGKGDAILVDGEIQVRSYDKDGRKQFVTEIVAHEVGFVESKKESDPKFESVSPDFESVSPKFETVSLDEDIPF